MEQCNDEIIIYQPNDNLKIEVRLNDEMIWLSQPQIVQLFQSSKSNISEHIRNIYSQNELDKNTTVRNFRTVQQEGNRNVYRNIAYYNLDVIISVGTIYTEKINKQLQLDIELHDSQYPVIDIKIVKKCHDRFLIIDNEDVFHIGASLKDLGKKLFAFSKLNFSSDTILKGLV